MHFHLPKALHNWRELVQEIAVIVIGILIALSAEQIVQDYPSLTIDDVRASIEYAADIVRERLIPLAKSA